VQQIVFNSDGFNKRRQLRHREEDGGEEKGEEMRHRKVKL